MVLPAGVKGYDMLFDDVSDRDAGYYKYVYGNAGRLWDRDNVTFPNFQRWETYVVAAGQATGKPIIVWQVPEGNQYFDTENNTNGHYQDNRAEYFFSHVAELARSGIIGVLFGAGNGGSSVEYDGMNDGVTNPAGFCTSDGISSGQVCNNHVSSVSDDDGGYIRIEGQQYYAGGGYPLSGGALPADTAGPATVPPTTTSTSEATATSSPTALPPTTTTTPTPTSSSTPIPATHCSEAVINPEYAPGIPRFRNAVAVRAANRRLDDAQCTVAA